MTYIAPQEKLFGHLDRLHELKTAERTAAPINVEIDLSNRCSLGCEWCHFAFTHTRGPLAGKRAKPKNATPGGDLMDTALAKKIVLQLYDAGVRSITWTGGGEPTLHPDFDEIVRFAATLNICQGIYTHGGHITEERAALLKHAMTFVYVSLDAATAEAYKRDKGVDRFQAACDGIRRLVAADGEATIGVGFLVTERNYNDVGLAADLAWSMGADYLQVRPTILYDQDNPDTPAENTAWMSDAIASITKARNKGKAGVMQYSRPKIVADIDRFRMYQNWSGHGYETCWWSMLQTCVTPNGKVWVCVNKREHDGGEIGDLSVEPFAKVWARHEAAKVTDDCRVLCRGHLPNVALDGVMAKHPHPEFV